MAEPAPPHGAAPVPRGRHAPPLEVRVEEQRHRRDGYEALVARGLAAFFSILAAHPDQAQTLLVEIVGAGPRAIARRDAIMDRFATLLLRDSALLQLVARQLRTGQPAHPRDVAPTPERVIHGVLHQASRA